MPLLDHFHPPLSRTHPWRAFHGAWAAAIARGLNEDVLPPGFYAIPFFDADGPIEIDVATLRSGEPIVPTQTGRGRAWQPTEPASVSMVEWPATDEVRVEILTDDGDPRVAAVVELVSPRNKDRPRAREAFASKCADHLRRGSGLVIVDVVTTRRADLHSTLLQALAVEPEEAEIGAISAVSYRSTGRTGDNGGPGELQAWTEALDVGQPLPTLPLWLGASVAVPLDLEVSHARACEDLRIRQAG